MFAKTSKADVKDVVTLQPYEDYVKEINYQMRFIESSFVPVTEIETIEEEDRKMHFLASFCRILRLLNIIKTFSDYQKSDLLMPLETLREYQKLLQKIA